MINNKKGITLIALVVTIVVLLILAGVSIAMLGGENGIIKQAVEAKDKNKKSEIEEKVNLAAQAASMDELGQEIKKDKFSEELDKNFGPGVANLEYDESQKEYTVTVDDYEVKVSNKGQVAEAVKSSISIKFTLSHTEEVPTAGGNVSEIREENVPIPTGFTYVEGTKDTGLVIADGEGNEFVWVPVNQNQKLTLEVTSKENITGIKLIGPDGAETTLTASGKTFNQEIAMTKNGVYTAEVSTANTTKTAEKRVTSLYAQDFEMNVIADLEDAKQYSNYNTIDELLTDKGYANIDALLEGEGYSTLAEYFGEEHIYVVGYEKEFKAGGRVFYNIYKDNNQNTESVNEYGGFYIARYEAGDGTTSSARTSSTLDTNVLVSKKGAYVYNYVDWETSRTLATGLESSNTAVTSQLITGAGWDRTLNWIIETGSKTENEVILDSRSWGNYNNSIGNAAENSGGSNMNYTTGRSEYWKANNIYDLAGNTWEWTQERNGTHSLLRGGSFDFDGDKGTASDRSDGGPTGQNAHLSFRVQLYINV